MVMSGFWFYVVVSFGFIFVHWIHNFKYSDCPTSLVNTTHWHCDISIHCKHTT